MTIKLRDSTWKGNLDTNGNSTGKGVITWKDSDTFTGTIETSDKNGNWVGTGTYKYGENNSVYVGKLVNGDKEGKGILTWSNGDKYVGMFTKGHATGLGTLTSQNKVYDGMWKNGFRHGKGKETKPNGDSYDGEWENNLPHGYGIRLFADGRKWEGTWKKGQLVGEGKCSIPFKKSSVPKLPKI
jgi:hypothetical protein